MYYANFEVSKLYFGLLLEKAYMLKCSENTYIFLILSSTTALYSPSVWNAVL